MFIFYFRYFVHDIVVTHRYSGVDIQGAHQGRGKNRKALGPEVVAGLCMEENVWSECAVSVEWSCTAIKHCRNSWEDTHCINSWEDTLIHTSADPPSHATQRTLTEAVLDTHTSLVGAWTKSSVFITYLRSTELPGNTPPKASSVRAALQPLHRPCFHWIPLHALRIVRILRPWGRPRALTLLVLPIHLLCSVTRYVPVTGALYFHIL